MLYQFLLYRKMNQYYMYILPSHSGHHSALSRVPCVIQQVIYFIHSISSIYVSISVSQFLPPHCFPLVPIYLFSTPVSLFLLYKYRLYHFSRFHIYELIYNICFSLTYFSLFDTMSGSFKYQHIYGPGSDFIFMFPRCQIQCLDIHSRS